MPSPAADPSPLALVTVTHNSSSQLAELLQSMADHLPGVPIVVVDSASQDDSVKTARSFPTAVSIALRDNVGYGRASNLAIAEVSAPVTVLVNPDVVLLDDSLLGLAGELARSDRPERLLAPLVLCADGSRQDTVHPVPGAPADLIRTLVPPAIVPGRAGLPLAPWRSRRPRPVGWAVGCALGARTETLRRLGPFDESIFLYGEDMELGLRAAQYGIRTWFWPDARLVHHRAHSSAAAFGGEPFERLAQARHDVIARRLGQRRAALDDAMQAATFLSRIAFKRALGRPTRRERSQYRAVHSLRRRWTDA